MPLHIAGNPPLLQHWPHSLAAVLRREPQPSLGVGVEKETVVQRVAVENCYKVLYYLQNSDERCEGARRTLLGQTSSRNGKTLPV